MDMDFGYEALGRVGKVERVVVEEPDAVDAEFGNLGRGRHEWVPNYDPRGTGRDINGPDDTEGGVGCEQRCRIEGCETIEEDGILDDGGNADVRYG